MEEWKVIGLLSIALIASGCGDTPAKQGIVVNELDVDPSTMMAGGLTTVSVEAENAGLLEGSVDIGGEDNGSRVLTNYCSDMFKIKEFSASSSRSSKEQSVYDLKQGDRIRLNWRLNQFNSEEVPLPGYNCNMRFQIPFNYTVNAYKQVQVKESRSVEGSKDLAEDMTRGPLGIDMELVGSTSDQRNTLLTQDDNSSSLYITTYNRGDNEENEYKGMIRVGEMDVELKGNDKINLTGHEGGKCGNATSAALASGGEKIYRCNFEFDEFDDKAIRGEVTASVNYTYVRDLGSKNVEVKYNGDDR